MRRRAKRLLRIACVLFGAAVLVLAFGVFANERIARAARDAVHTHPATVPKKAVAIVFGAKAWETGPSHILQDRLDAAIQLYRLGTVDKLLLSGDHGRKDYDEVNTMADYAFGKGVPREDLFLDHAGFRTYDTLYRARDVFGVTSAVLVTNRFHLPRAIYTARRFHLDVVGLASDARTYRSRLWNDCREFLARTLAWTEVNVTRPKPRFLGERIDITGDGRVTCDRP